MLNVEREVQTLRYGSQKKGINFSRVIQGRLHGRSGIKGRT